MLTIFIVLLILVGAVALAFMFVRMGAKVVKHGKHLTPEATAALGKLVAGAAPLRGEMTSGDRMNPPSATGAGALALFKDELIFLPASGAPWRLALADLKDMTEIRAVSALDMAEAVADTVPDYQLKLSWDGGAATFNVHDATAWIAAIAGARP